MRVAAWLNLIFQTVLVGTGGAVRLTASGLGCPTWPKCTAGSFVTTPEMGIHGIIEFGNRTLFFVLQIVALIALLFVLKLRKERPDLFVLAVIPACSVLLQAVVGGITVLSQLNPYVVGLHFVLSVVLVVLGAVFVYRTYTAPGPRERVVPAWFAGLTHATSFFVAITVLVGILTTGSGPHAGDHGSARNNLPTELMEHVHSWPAYVTLALTIVLVIAAWTRGITAPRSALSWLFVVEGVQIIVGVTQARTGLPGILVGTHMVLACVLAAVMAVAILQLKQPVRTSAVARDL
nr:COX15/CtaA family protein [Microbacterium humi]